MSCRPVSEPVGSVACVPYQMPEEGEASAESSAAWAAVAPSVACWR